MLKAGIVGLPNVGKSTLFNAVTRSHKAAAENYPFCTIEPNLGVVTVPDSRLDALAKVTGTPRVIPAAIEFVDIAGLVAGASRGEGLGNKFLSHIREVDALVHVVRCFDDPDIHHVTGSVAPVRDIDIVVTELVTADLETVHKRLEKVGRDAKRGDKTALAEETLLRKLEPHLNAGNPAATLARSPEESHMARHFFLLTDKPTLFAANVRESELTSGDRHPHVRAVCEYARAHQGCDTLVFCAQLESDLADLTPEEAAEYLETLRVAGGGGGELIRRTCQLLGLRTFFTFNDTETRAWTVAAGATAPQAAGRVHTDFERGFIKAEAVPWQHLVEAGSIAHARERGHYRVEGREYVVRDGDVLLFKFHV
ncbi:MAG: redox-regulated ATPase YchF [Verrucomicrobia bacterium]|nr:redox-regulated ATPase YchF [Verrucomicrobiota bacterium]